MTAFTLSATLSGHDDDVRAVVFPASNTVITASRDHTVRLWQTTAVPPVYSDMISSHGEGFINTAAYIPPSSRNPDGLIVSGGADAIIDIRQPGKEITETPEALLIGHAMNVCALSVDEQAKFLISGSWDRCAKIWSLDTWQCEATLEGHEGSVWAVLAYDRETIITGAADKLIRIYHRSGKLLKTIEGNEDVVRALCRLPQGHASGADFASAGNDGCIRLWAIDGRQLAVIPGHESFIYSLAVLPSGELVSSGEDRTVRIWRGLDCVQTIVHPAISVWSVAVCAESGDIVTGASDRMARVFTRSSERFAAAEVLASFEDSVKSSAIPQEQVAQASNNQQLPGPAFLQEKSGTKEGQVVMIREADGSKTAHMWSTISNSWTCVGSVVEAAASSGNKIDFNGKSYDFVFDVDIEDGKPPLKLPFNLSQNPYDAASRFIAANELPITYLEQVANFIVTNTQGHTVGAQQDTNQAALPPGSDPWGSESRYRPGSGVSSQQRSSSPPKILPQKSYLSIMVANVDKMEQKLLEINSTLLVDGNKKAALDTSELSTLTEIVKHLRSNNGNQPSSFISQSNRIDVIPQLASKMIISWPYAVRLPALDLVRLVAPLSNMAAFKDLKGNIIDRIISSVTEQDPPAENNVMMAIRAFTNLFGSEEGRKLVYDDFDKIQPFTISPLQFGTTNRNLLVAIATLYVNYAVLFTKEAPDFDRASRLIENLGAVLSKETDTEVIYRAMVATGTLLTNGEICTAAKMVYDIEKHVQKALSRVKDPRTKNVASEIKALLK